MQFFARRTQCGHIIWAGPLADTAATLSLTEELLGITCPTCGELVENVDFVGFREESSAFDKAPEPRRTENKLQNMSRWDARRSRKHLAEQGADIRGLAAKLKDAALDLTPLEWRRALSRIPVGVLPTYEPNAQCIRFKDSSVPALVFHRGLAGFLFKMNRSIVPLLKLGTMRGKVTAFVTGEAQQRALRIQAVGTALEFLGAGRPQGKDLVAVPLITKFLEMALTRTMSSFLLCHEYGHAVLDHTDEIRSIGGSGSPRFYLLERSRAMEFEADTWGQDAVIGAFTQGRKLEKTLDVLDELVPSNAATLKKDISLASPCIALLYFEFLDAVEELLVRYHVPFTAQSAPLGGFRWRTRQGGRDAAEQGTHPSNRERFQALYAHLSRHGNFTAHTWVGAFEGLLDDIKADLEKLTDESRLISGTEFSGGSGRRPAGKRKPKSWRDESLQPDEMDADMRRRMESVLNKVSGEFGTPVRLDQAEVERRVRRLTDEAIDHFEARRYAEAERAFRNVLNLGETPDSLRLYPMLGTCHENRGDIPGAMAVYRRCIDVAPDSEPAAVCAFSLGRIMLFDQKDRDAAETALAIATRSTVPDIKAYATFWLGTIAHDRGDADAALAKYTDVYERRAELGSVFPGIAAMAAVNIGSIYEERRQYRAAFAKFTYARKHGDPDTREIAAERLRELP